MTHPRRTWRLILLLSGILPPIVPPAPAQTQDYEQARRLSGEFDDALYAEDWSRAIELGLKLNAVAPGNAPVQYELARACVRAGNVDEAVKWLTESVENGFDRLNHFTTDPVMEPIRKHAKYAAMLDMVKQSHGQFVADLEEAFARDLPQAQLPPNFVTDQPSPLIVVMHPFGAWADYGVEIWKAAAADMGAVLVAPHATRRVEGEGFNWVDVDHADVLVQCTLKHMRKLYKIDDRRIILAGYGQGALMASKLGTLRPEEFAGIVATDIWYTPNRDAPSKATGTRLPRFYFITDQREAPASVSRQAAEDFGKAGYTVEITTYARVYHTMPQGHREVCRQALASVLGEQAALLPLTWTAEDEQVLRLGKEYDDAYDEENWSKAIETGLKLDALVPGNALLQYNIACVCALDGRTGEAIGWLRKSAENGYKSFAHLNRDSDLDSIRSHADFAAVAATIRSNGDLTALAPNNRYYILQQEFVAALQAKDLPRMRAIAGKLHAIHPHFPVLQVQLARWFASAGEPDDAVGWLKKAVENGYRDYEEARTDSDLLRIRSHPQYATVLAAIKENGSDFVADLKKKFDLDPLRVRLPPDHRADQPAPLIVALHGWGADGDDLLGLWTEAAGDFGAILVTPQAVEPVEAGGYSWVDEEQADILVRHTLDQVRKKHRIDDKRIILTGFSQGGGMAHVLGLRYPETFAGVIEIGAAYPPLEWPFRKAAGERPPRFYIMVGERDDLLRRNRAAAEGLSESGYAVKLVTFPDVGHDVPQPYREHLGKALAFVLGE